MVKQSSVAIRRPFARLLLGGAVVACAAVPVAARLGAEAGRNSHPTSRGWETFLARELNRPVTRPLAPHDAIAAKIVKAAHAQEGDDYDASYVTISYPGGDVPAGSGACTDVVVRALRGAGVDLQQLIHEDVEAHFARYPAAWNLGHADANIDQRRVPNQMAFFQSHGLSLPLATTGKALATWQPGDIVDWKPGPKMWHTGIISDHATLDGLPLVIHNGYRCTEQNVLTAWPIIGHFRYPVRKEVAALP